MMGLTKALGLTVKSMFDKRVLGDQTLESTEVVYRQHKRKLPGKSQHAWLAETWLNRMRARGEEVNNTVMRKKAFDETFVHACLTPEQCSRSLGLAFLYEENPMFLQKYPVYLEEYVSMVGPVLDAFKLGEVTKLYRRYNNKKNQN